MFHHHRATVIVQLDIGHPETQARYGYAFRLADDSDAELPELMQGQARREARGYPIAAESFDWPGERMPLLVPDDERGDVPAEDADADVTRCAAAILAAMYEGDADRAYAIAAELAEIVS